MKKILNTMNGAAAKTHLFGIRAKEKAAAALRGNEGEGFVDTALKILISVVVGALLLAGLYMLFKDTLLPTLTERIIALFDYNGN